MSVAYGSLSLPTCVYSKVPSCQCNIPCVPVFRLVLCAVLIIALSVIELSLKYSHSPNTVHAHLHGWLSEHMHVSKPTHIGHALSTAGGCNEACMFTRKETG